MNLYVGNLPCVATEHQLFERFSRYGEIISASIITDKTIGRSKGFGIVEMADDDEAHVAIEALSGSEFGGNNLIVHQSRPSESRSHRHND